MQVRFRPSAILGIGDQLWQDKLVDPSAYSIYDARGTRVPGLEVHKAIAINDDGVAGDVQGKVRLEELDRDYLVVEFPTVLPGIVFFLAPSEDCYAVEEESVVATA